MVVRSINSVTIRDAHNDSSGISGDLGQNRQSINTVKLTFASDLRVVEGRPLAIGYTPTVEIRPLARSSISETL